MPAGRTAVVGLAAAVNGHDLAEPVLGRVETGAAPLLTTRASLESPRHPLGARTREPSQIVGGCFTASARQISKDVAAPLGLFIDDLGKHPAPMLEKEFKRVKVPVQIHHGTADHAVSHERTQELEKSLRAQGTPVEVFLYENLDHGFLAYTRPARYDPAAAKLSWERTVRFLDRHLKS